VGNVFIFGVCIWLSVGVDIISMPVLFFHSTNDIVFFFDEDDDGA